jgi:dihydrodipicolinate synthase/N-acetylneuraminate lyase
MRVALRKNNLHQTPIIAGVGAASTRETINLAEDAAAAGANYVLVIVPSYYASALRTQPGAVKQFFVDVASKSPLPVYVSIYALCPIRYAQLRAATDMCLVPLESSTITRRLRAVSI